MYQVDELIDHIRELESQRLEFVYSKIAIAINSCGDRYILINKVYGSEDHIPSNPSDILSEIVDMLHEDYISQIDGCCGGDEGCCGGLLSLQGYKERYLTIDPSPFFELDRLRNAPGNYGSLAGCVNDSYQDVEILVSIYKNKIQY